MVKKGPENVQLKALINFLEKAGTKNKAPVWKKAAFLLAKPTRQRPEVNLYSIEKNSKDGSTVLVPGKVLSQGMLSHKVTLAAFRVSKPAAAKLAKNGSKTISLNQLVETNPTGKGVVFLVK
ncbi:50S ribosomal protein L18e [Candidatus Micrarchaeota archaeon]|nr:50S ribosomal protein L18e [Candidatus Micrarchaeota archaeon]